MLENLPASGSPARAAPPPPSRSRSTSRPCGSDLVEAGVAESPHRRPDHCRRGPQAGMPAGIIPFVMGGKSVVLDQGRKKRLHDETQRAAVASALLRVRRPPAARSPSPGREIHHPRSLERRAATTSHRGRHPALSLPSPPGPRPRLERELPPRRHDDLHQADVSRACAWHDRQPSAAWPTQRPRGRGGGRTPPARRAADATAAAS